MAWITGAQILALPTPPDVTPAQAQDAAEAACALVDTWCGRAIEGATYREWADAVGPHSLLVAHPPVERLYRACTTTAYGLSLTNATADANSITASVQDGVMHLSVFGGASASDLDLTLATYGTMALLLAAIVALPQGWAGAVENEGDPQDIKPEFLGNVLDASALYPLIPDGDASLDLIDRKGGLLWITDAWASGIGENFVRYTGGYATVPPALVNITLQLAADLIRDMGRDSSLAGEHLDKYAWTRAADADLRNSYRNRLAPWRLQRIP